MPMVTFNVGIITLIGCEQYLYKDNSQTHFIIDLKILVVHQEPKSRKYLYTNIKY